MHFDKPVVLLTDIPDIVAFYDCGSLIDAKYLGGVPNVTFRVIFERARLAVRIGNHGYTSRSHLDTEIDILRYLVTRGFRLSPEPVAGVDGEFIHEWRGYPTFATRLIEGIPCDRVPITDALCFSVGRALGHLQAHLAAYPRPLPAGETFSLRAVRLIEALPSTSRNMGWDIDCGGILRQWEAAVTAVETRGSTLRRGLMHTDVWPPNVICERDQVTGIVDFDDWAHGPIFIDLAACLTEFAMYCSTELDCQLCVALLNGYFQSAGVLTDAEASLLLEGIELSCISWLACNALHRIQFAESVVYLNKLQLLRDNGRRAELARQFGKCLKEAQGI